MDKREALIDKTCDDHLSAIEFVDLAVAERKKWAQDKEGYESRKAPELVRELCIVTESNYKNGICSELNANVEHIRLDVAYRLHKAAGAPDDVPLIEWADEFVKNRNRSH